MKVFWLVFILTISFAANAQNERRPLFSKHTFSAEFGGLSPYSMNYECIINPERKVKLALSGGGAYIPIAKEHSYYFSQIKFTALLGKGPFYYGAGLNVLHILERYRNFHRNYDYGVTSETNAYVSPYLHIRYQPQEKGFFAGVSAYYLLISDYAIDLDKYTNEKFELSERRELLLPSLSFGYTFNSNKQ